jgi:hypothetical protein
MPGAMSDFGCNDARFLPYAAPNKQGISKQNKLAIKAIRYQT